MTKMMIFCLLVLLVGVAGCVFHSIKAKRDPEKHTCEWRDFANGCIGTLIGALMAILAIT